MKHTWSATYGECYYADEAGEWWWVAPDGKLSILIEKE